ncbi:MAG: Mu-like prophage major head subunit gpT family protein [Rhodobacteraceae bacterium]|nr:Mu-like prophage major head subunit gpT family protein [Paracoccaceae bacterium]
MLINAETLDLVFKGFKATNTDAYLDAPSQKDEIAMNLASTSRDETYGWMGMFPNMREWIRPRHVRGMTAHGFTIKNRPFESTVEVRRIDIADDKIGVFKPAFTEMGQNAKRHPDEMIFSLLASGFATECYDGQNFFDTDHPLTLDGPTTTTVSNMQTGSSTPWFLLDVSRGVRSLIWQEREPYTFQQMTRDEDEYVFKTDNYLYGIRARANAGFGLWQLAFGSKATLDETNYAAARAAMMGFQADGGRKLGITPNVLVVPPPLESAALHLLNTETKDGGGSNPWKGTAKLIVTPYLS